MLARLSAFVIWALIAATAVFWGLRVAVQPAAAPVHSVATFDATAGRSDLTRLLGMPAEPLVSVAATPEASSRFRLLGIMAPPKRQRGEDTRQGGLALIAVDGKPPRPFAVGARVDGDLVLQSVSLRAVSIGPAKGAETLVLEIPPFAAPATGTLPAPGGPVAPAPLIAPPPPLTPPAVPPPPVIAPAAANPAAPMSMQNGVMTQ